MGERGNILVINEEKEIFLYTHWYGYKIKQILQAALKRGYDRWKDGSYITRIIFSEMIQKDLMGTTGYGISPYRISDNYEMVIFNVDDQSIKFENDDKIYTIQEFLDTEFEEDWKGIKNER